MFILNQISPLKIPQTLYSGKNYNLSAARQADTFSKSNSNQLQGYGFYNPAFYGINFTGAKLKVQMQRLKMEEFPSNDFYNYAKNALEENPDTEKTIFDIHTEFYENLFNAGTLEEAKAQYPEIAGVIDAKDYIKVTDYKNLPYGIRKIYDGEVKGITIEDLTLDLLKKVYDGMRDRHNKNNYYGFANRTIDKMLEALNIKTFSEHYSRAYRSCRPQNMQIMSKAKKKYFENPENVTKNAQAQKNAYAKNPERRQAASERMKALWASMTPEEKVDYQAKLHAGLCSDDSREKMSEAGKQLWQDEEYREKQRIYHAIRKEVWDNHPEIKEVMSTLAQEEFPLLGKFISIPENERTAAQNTYIAKYFARVNELLPDAMKTIGHETKEALLKFKKENSLT